MTISNGEGDLKTSVPCGVAVDNIHKTDSSDNTSASNETDDAKYPKDCASPDDSNMIGKDGNVSPSQPLAPPPPPAPAPPPPPCLSTPVSLESHVTKERKDATVTRWDPKLVSWMKKTLWRYSGPLHKSCRLCPCSTNWPHPDVSTCIC